MADIYFNLPAGKTYYTFQKVLENVTYSFTLRYLKRLDAWVLDVGEEIKGALVTGGIDILGQFHHLNVPPGRLELYDYDGLNRTPSETNFGDRITLKYIEI